MSRREYLKVAANHRTAYSESKWRALEAYDLAARRWDRHLRESHCEPVTISGSKSQVRPHVHEAEWIEHQQLLDDLDEARKEARS